MSVSKATGAAGEEYVSNRLAGEGYQIIGRNWRMRGGEIDLVALDGNMLVFVEVKVRGRNSMSADDAVSYAQLRRLLNAGEGFVQRHAEHRERMWRVDLIAVSIDRNGRIERYNHYKNLTLE